MTDHPQPPPRIVTAFGFANTPAGPQIIAAANDGTWWISTAPQATDITRPEWREYPVAQLPQPEVS